MRYSVVQIDVASPPARRENIGLVAEDAIGRLREILVDKNSLAAKLALGESTFHSLGKNVQQWYESGDWKTHTPASFLGFLSGSKLFNVRFSTPEPVPEIDEALRLLYKARVLRQSKQTFKAPQRILSTRGLNVALLAHFLGSVESVDKLRLQKTLYLAELSQEILGCNGLKYGFFKYLHGPFSREIYAHLDALERERLVARQGFSVRITDAGKQFLAEASALLQEYPVAIRTIEETVAKWRNRSTRELVAASYATVPMQQSDFSDDLLPLVPEERFSWVPTSASPAFVTKLETMVLSSQMTSSPKTQ